MLSIRDKDCNPEHALRLIGVPEFQFTLETTAVIMKGTVVLCLQELVEKRFGAEKWKQALLTAGLSEVRLFSTLEDVSDEQVFALAGIVSKTTKVPRERLREMFGEYWSNQYAPRIYGSYYRKAKTARDLLQNLDHIHTAMTNSMPGARPPRFKYHWTAPNVLTMHYESKRGLVGLMPGLIRGVGKYYNEALRVTVKDNSVSVRFP